MLERESSRAVLPQQGQGQQRQGYIPPAAQPATPPQPVPMPLATEALEPKTGGAGGPSQPAEGPGLPDPGQVQLTPEELAMAAHVGCVKGVLQVSSVWQQY